MGGRQSFLEFLKRVKDDDVQFELKRLVLSHSDAQGCGGSSKDRYKTAVALLISKKGRSSVWLVGGRALRTASQFLLSTYSFPGRIVCLRHDTVLSKERHFHNFSVTSGSRSSAGTVRSYAK